MAGILLTHGLGDSAATWAEVRPALEARHHVRTWELPGHGGRLHDVPDDYDLRHAAAELEAVVHGATPPVVLVGHSAGGYASLRCAVVLDAPVVGVVLISTGPGFRRQSDMSRWNEAMDRLADRLWLPAGTGRIAHQHDAAVIEALPGSRVPALVIQGSDDVPQYRAGSDYLLRHLPAAEGVEIPNAKHDPHRTHPDLVARSILDFADAVTR